MILHTLGLSLALGLAVRMITILRSGWSTTYYIDATNGNDGAAGTSIWIQGDVE